MFRPAAIIAAATLLAGCAADEPYAMSERASQRLAEAIGDKVAGEPRDCLAADRMDRPNVIDGRHILFRDGRTTWLNQPDMRCPLLGSPGRVLVIQPTLGRNVCEGDFARVLDVSTGSFVGACAFGDFTPYRAAER